MSGGASLMMRVVFPIRGVRDFTCGFRAYRATTLRAAVSRYGDEFVNQAGFQCMVDILLRLRSMNLVIGEVPFVLRYDRKGGESKMNVWRTVRNTLSLLARRRIGL
jgi:dolichol-phosphate mannosyltransferase